MDALREVLVRSEPLLLFVVIGIGYVAGQIRVLGFQLGIAGVLFAGLAFGAWRAEDQEPLRIAPQLTEVGLILFVYAVGLASGPGFFASLRQRGVRFNVSILVALCCGAALALLVGRAMGLSDELISGAYCGGLTNTPALAAVTELVQNTVPEQSTAPTLGYSISYPFGVLGALVAFQGLAALRRKTLESERRQSAERAGAASQLVARNYEISNPNLFEMSIGELRVREAIGLMISRMRHDERVFVPTKYTSLRPGDVVVAVGPQAAHEKAVEYFGAESSERLEQTRAPIEVRRILVSNRELVGKTVDDLEIDRHFNAQITRLRRGDIDVLPGPEMVIELGARLRVVAPSDRMAEVSAFFGDSQRRAAELDFTAMTIGISVGVLLGMVPIPLPGGNTVSLGFAGGPLVVGLVLGKLIRSGPFLWAIPLEAEQALRHVGLLFFLAGVGVKAGANLLNALSDDGLRVFVLGALITTVTTVLAMGLLWRYAHAGVVATLGATSGMQTQPATLARAHEICGTDEVYVSYATTYPAAMIAKILLAQLLVIIGRGL